MINQNKEIVLVTGCAGFIGMHLSKELLEKKYHVIGVDNLNDYYSTKLKEDRLNVLKKYNSFDFIKLDITKKGDLEKVFKRQSCKSCSSGWSKVQPGKSKFLY
jgi:UDP-glucuronate 4-epimerase